MIQNRSKIIGITGGIATGKSTAVAWLYENGFQIVDADKISKALTKKGEKGYTKIVEVFGKEYLYKNGALNRKKLGELIFEDKGKREELNQILHPMIRKELLKKIEKLMENQQVVFVDIPLLFEAREYLKKDGIVFDEVWLIYTDLDNQIDRLIKRDSTNRMSAISRIRAQMDIEKKRKLADVIIYNNGSIAELYEQLNKYTKHYR